MKIKKRTGILNNVFNSMDDYAIISIDNEENVIALNNIAMKQFGLLKDDIIGKNISEISEIQEYIKNRTENYIDDAMRKGKSKHIYKLTDDKGTEKIFETEFFSIKDEYGENSGFTITIKDISYLKKFKGSEVINGKVLNLMLEESSNSIIIVREDFTIEGISKNAEYLIGINKDNVQGMFIWDIFFGNKKIKDFMNYVFKDNDDKEIKTFNTVAVNTKININMRVKLINDSSTENKKVIIYL